MNIDPLFFRLMKYLDIIPPPKKNIPIAPFARTGGDASLFSSFCGWKKYAAKLTALLLMIGMNWAGISAVGTVLAYYFDLETASGSVFAAGGLDFSLSDSGWIPAAAADDLGAGASVSRDVTIEDMVASSSVPFQYVANMLQTGGDAPYCKKLQLDAQLEGVSVYQGDLLDFNFATTTFATSTSDEWQLDVSLPHGTQLPFPAFCNFDYIVNGWQVLFASSTHGFHDEEHVPMAVRSTAQEAPVCFAGKLADFDADSSGAPIENGNRIDDEYISWGLEISGENIRRNTGTTVAFDTGHPTDGEEEFGTPNEDFGGPGIGNGGEAHELGENSIGKQNALIIPKMLRPAGRRGDLFDGYRADSGILYFKFDTPTFIESLRVLNNVSDEDTVKLFDTQGNVLRVLYISDFGKNSIQEIGVLTGGVSEMRITMKKEAAIDDICFGVKSDEVGSRSPIVLNEFLPNPDGKQYGYDFGRDNDKMPKGEWVEIYNNSSDAIDVAGWYIHQGSSGGGNKVEITPSNTDTGSTVVEGNSWLVVYMNKALLSNRRGKVKFFNERDMLIDAYEYEHAEFCELEPTPGDENDENGTGSCSGVPGNKSFARIPDGVGAWIDPVPTPGRENIVEISSSIDQASFIVEGDVLVVPPIEEQEVEVDEVATTSMPVIEIPIFVAEDNAVVPEVVVDVDMTPEILPPHTVSLDEEAVISKNDSEKELPPAETSMDEPLAPMKEEEVPVLDSALQETAVAAP